MSWYKANLHCHIQNKELFKSHGYNIVAFTDRKLNYYDEFNDDEFLALPGLEEKRMFEPETNKIYHFNCFPKHRGVKEVDLPAGIEYNLENANKVIKAYVDADYLVMYNHPVASFHESCEALGLDGIFAVEIYNNVVEVINRTGCSDVYYDMMLRNGHKIWAIAADDSQRENSFDTPYNHYFGGFVMIKAPALTQADIIQALENGDFYSCVGKNGIAPQIHNMYIEDNIFCADFTPVKSVYLKNSYWKCPHKLSYGDDITHVEFEIDNTWKYVRLEITDSNGYRAMGNPYFLSM